MSHTILILLSVLALAHANFTLERVHLSFRAEDLCNRDTGFKLGRLKVGGGLSDPYFELFAVNNRTQKPEARIFKTGIVDDNLAPGWNEKFVVVKQPYENQSFFIHVWNDNGKKKPDCLGTTTVSLRDILQDCQSLGKYERSLSRPDGIKIHTKNSRIVITATVLAPYEELIHVKLTGHQLKATDVNGKCDPYVEIYVPDASGEYSRQPFHKTPFVKGNRMDPTWDTIEIYTDVLNIGGSMRNFLFKVRDYDNIPVPGMSDLIGECIVQPSELIPAAANSLREGILSLSKNGGKIKYKVYKTLSLKGYTNSGLVDLTHQVAIDFTDSNRSHQFNHHWYNYMNVGDADNVYSRALGATGKIMDRFQPPTKFYDVYGFGGRVPAVLGNVCPVATFGGIVEKAINYNNYTLNHSFNLNTLYKIPQMYTARGIIDTYFRALPYVDLSGPSDCVSVIQEISKQLPIITKNGERTPYSVLVIFTTATGENKVKLGRALIAASKKAISIIIVGVGPGDFQLMRELDNDDHVWVYEGDRAERDPMQFVRLQDFLPNSTLIDPRILDQYEARLFLEFYAELSPQLRQNMKLRLYDEFGF